MHRVLYIDILFWMNWIFDGVLLILTGRWTHRKLRFMRIGLAAAAGAGIAVICEISVRGAVLRSICGILLPPVCMVGIAFTTRKAAELLYELVHLSLAAVLLGGSLHVLYENTGFGRFYRQWMQGTGWEVAAVWMLALSMLAVLAMLEVIGKYRELGRARELLHEVTLTCGDRTVSVMALWDSGNQLFDPSGHEPVHLIGYESCRRLLPEGEADKIGLLLYGGQAGACPDVEEENHGLHLIPFRTVGNASGVLPVVRITAMEAAGLGTWQSPRIGICRDGLSENDRYQMLLHSEWKQSGIKGGQNTF